MGGVGAFTNADGLELLARQRGVNFAPGAQYPYCNSGYKLLAELVPRTAGRSLRQYAEERIFGPLGMSCTFFDDANEPLEQRVQSYEPTDDGRYEFIEKRFTIVGSGGVVTTMEDLARWDRNFYEPRVGGQEFLQTLQTPGRLNDGTPTEYACGLVIGEYKGLRTVSHAGGMLGFRTHMLRFPEQQLTVICLANLTSVDAEALAADVADLYLGPDYRLSDWAGTYHSAELSTTWELVTDGANLVLRQPASLAGILCSSRPDQFRRNSRRLQFQRGQDGQVSGFILNAPRARGIGFVRAPNAS